MKEMALEINRVMGILGRGCLGFAVLLIALVFGAALLGLVAMCNPVFWSP